LPAALVKQHMPKLIVLLLFSVAACAAAESDALAISQNIQAIHMPFGTVLDPIYASPTSTQIVGYTRCGDSALWTGAYLASEAFRYNVTKSADALNNVTKAVAGLKSLADVTGTNLLARCLVPINSPYEAGIASEESANGIYTNSSAGYIWVGNTSRDEYTGAIFGLGIAYDMVDNATVQASISALVTRLVRFLTGNNWSVVMPNGSTSTTFLIRPDELLALLQVGRHLNPGQFGTYYDVQRILLSATVSAPILVDDVDDSSYFKFNLDYMTFYNLIRLESSSAKTLYQEAYSLMRSTTQGDQNAFFDIVDRGLNGANAARDQETLELLDQWLLRSRRDFPVDLTKTVAVCGSQACKPIPVPERVPDEFIWQVSPYQLTGGGTGLIETGGIDYILPFWMAQYYGVKPAFGIDPAAASEVAVAPDSLAALYGTNLASQTASATAQPLPMSLGGVSVSVTDAAGTTRSAPLIYVSPTQINLEVPDGTAAGTATFTITNGSTTTTATANVLTVAPSLFSADGTGTGVAAASAVQGQATVSVFQCGSSGCTAAPIDVAVDTPIYLTLYASGIRHLDSLSNVRVTINGISVPVSYAGAQPSFAGLDQVNVSLPPSLQGSGLSSVLLTVDGRTSNAVQVDIQ
jgi:uncharacterized protein (TIGR03437 family)